MSDDGTNHEPSPWDELGDPVPLVSGAAATVPRAEPNGDKSFARRSVEPVAGTHSAAEFVAERMLRPPVAAPSNGWRRIIFRVTGGTVRLGPSAKERRKRELVARVKTPVEGCRRIAFISRKGGVGKTTTCLLVGHTFALYRGDRVIALDGNPDAGTLAHRVRRETSATVTSLLARTGGLDRYADIRGYTSQAATRLEVIAADDDPQITQAIGRNEFQRAIGVLEHHYNIVCLDTGTGVLESATRGILDSADQIVVVSAPSLDGARAASSTLDWLEQNGYRHLVVGAVAVINGIRPQRGLVDLDRLEAHFAARCRAHVRIPFDPHLEAGAETAIEELREETRQAHLELAAAIATGFTEPTRREGVHR